MTTRRHDPSAAGQIRPGSTRIAELGRRVLTLVAGAAVGASMNACARSDAPTDGAPGVRVKLGYTASSSAAQQQLEARYRALISAESMSALHKPLTQRPHPAGSPGTKDVVKYLQTTLAGFGLDVQTHEYQVLVARPRTIEIAMTAPTRRRLSTDEPAIPEDPTSAHPELTGGYVAYSASGTAAGQVVYVNYGLPADYADLAKLGVSLKGRIALFRLPVAKPIVLLNLEVDVCATLLAKRDPLGPLPQGEETMHLGHRPRRTDDDADIEKSERRLKRRDDVVPSGHADFFGILKNDSTLSLFTGTPAATSSSSNTWFTSPSPAMKA